MGHFYNGSYVILIHFLILDTLNDFSDIMTYLLNQTKQQVN